MIILIAFIGAYTMPFVGSAVEKAGIDDAVGAFAVHGYCGLLGAMTVGVMAAGYPQGDGIPLTGFLGQFVGTFVCTIILGFIPDMASALFSKNWVCFAFPEKKKLLDWTLPSLVLKDIQNIPSYLNKTVIHPSLPLPCPERPLRCKEHLHVKSIFHTRRV